MTDRGERARNRVGQVLREKLTLEAVIGVGGMATVYAATHRNGKRVAVKMLHPELSADADAKARFLREGYAANTIGHPGCVSVTDDDVAEDGSVFVVMELLEGETLSNRAERAGGRLPPSEVVHWTLLLLDVLAAAHDKGVIHRDLKPENIFVTKENLIKVLDFGIARTRATSQAKLTVTGSVMGTPAFMPPEQALAKWDLVDGRSDLWAVGASMFFLLTGRLVHEEDALTALLIAISTKPVVPIASVLPTIPPALAAIVDRALALDRERRFPDARAMQAALREAVATSPELLPSLVIVPATPGTRATTLEQMHGETLSSSPSLTPSLPEIVAKPQEQVETLLASGGTVAQKPKRPILPAIIAGVLALGILIGIVLVRATATNSNVTAQSNSSATLATPSASASALPLPEVARAEPIESAQSAEPEMVPPNAEASAAPSASAASSVSLAAPNPKKTSKTSNTSTSPLKTIKTTTKKITDAIRDKFK